MNNWFNACVAFERVMAVHKKVNFNKMLSKRIARWIIFILPISIMISIIHEPLYRDIYDDKDEQRYWCVFHYYPSIEIYNKIIILFHFIGPFSINIFSTLFIIFVGAYQRRLTQEQLTYCQHIYEQLKENHNYIISPIILVSLGMPGVIISMLSDCIKVSYNSWFYFCAYLIPFIPSMTIFIVFVLPSKFYKKQFKQAIKCRRR